MSSSTKSTPVCCSSWLFKVFPKQMQAELEANLRRPDCLDEAERILAIDESTKAVPLAKPLAAGQNRVSWSEVEVRGAVTRLERHVTCDSTGFASAKMPPKSPEAVVMAVLQHGSHGTMNDFGNISAALEQSWQESSGLSQVPLVLWQTPDNEGLKTDDGLEICGARLVSALQAGMNDISVRYPSAQLFMVVAAHSFGGPILRYALAKLAASGALDSVNLVAFLTLSSPHLGATQMNAMLRVPARGVGAIFSAAYSDLLLDSPALADLCSQEALDPLKRFSHRILYVCWSKDHLVSFQTGGITVPVTPLSVDVLPPCVDGHPHVRQGLLLEPFDDSVWDPSNIDGNDFFSCRDLRGSSAPTSSSAAVEQDGSSRTLMYAAPDGTAVASGICEAVKEEQCQLEFKGFDDHRGPDNEPVSELAARMLYSLRSVGQWTLHAVDFSEPVVVAHAAIINHPNKYKNPGLVGNDISKHVANKLCTLLRDALKTDA